MMKILKQFFKAISLRQFLAICLAGILIFTSTACGRTQSAKPFDSSQSNHQKMSKQNLSLYKDTQEGQDTTEAAAKADRLIQEAKKRTQKVQTREEYLNEITPDKPIQQQAQDIGQSAKQTVQKLGESAKQTAENATENTKKGFRNLKENTKNMVDEATDAIN
jgi:hypothetical protein